MNLEIPENLTAIEYWVLHSAYPNETWRGLEKCLGVTSTDPIGSVPSGPPIFFNTEEQARNFLSDWGYTEGLWRPVKVKLIVPAVGQPTKEEG